jgi:hypothetical protein
VAESGQPSAQKGFDIAQAFSLSKLSKGPVEQPIPAKELLDTAMAQVALDSKLKPIAGKQFPELRENALVLMR